MKTYKKWKTRIESPTPWTEKDIIYFRKYLNGNGKYSDELYELFYENMPNGGYDITPEQSQKGIDYLRTKSFKKNGQPTTRALQIFTEYQLNTIKDFYEFKLTNLYDTSVYWGGRPNLVAVYSCADSTGDCFEYLGIPFDLTRIV